MRIMFMHSIKQDKTESESMQSTSILYLHNLYMYYIAQKQLLKLKSNSEVETMHGFSVDPTVVDVLEKFWYQEG